MRPSVRQRIIGLGLLILLLLILVPWATQVPDKLQLRLDATMPDAPTVVWQPLVSPISDESLAQVTDDITRERQETLADSLSDTKNDADVLRAFALKLASFDSRAVAEAERQRLNDAGYRAYVRQQQKGFALYAGPELQRSRLTLLQLRLNQDKRFQFAAEQVVTYHP